MVVGGVVQDHAMGEAMAVRAWASVLSPVGELLLASDGDALTFLLFETHRGGEDPLLGRVRSAVRDDGDPLLGRVAGQLAEYFAGTRREFDVPLSPHGSEFQLAVWGQLRTIPYGATVSYGDIARRLGLAPGASRAVGLANGANPISIIIPCHRVIGADGSLTGYGGGLPRKRLLLDLESSVDGVRLF
jgi:methylated-DNA-[protein]-cysteine S-methyltransferase